MTSTKITYVTDYLNVMSDFREIKYKKQNLDFHKYKHINKERDTIEFFELFFTKYIQYAKIDINNNFIFVLKKIFNYDKILMNILKKYSHVNIRFVIIETKYNVEILDKNKDDFLCQYILCFLMKNNDKCILISNDKYRDKKSYIKMFNKASIRVLKLDNKKVHESFIELNNIDDTVSDLMFDATFKRSTVPKNKLHGIL